MPDDEQFDLDRYERGGYWRIDERTGERVRAYDTVEEWTGAIVARKDSEERHPQDFVRSRGDRQAVSKPRPPPPELYQGPPTTELSAAANAGATTISVLSSAEFAGSSFPEGGSPWEDSWGGSWGESWLAFIADGTPVAIMLDNGNRFLTTVLSVPDGTHLVLFDPLPWSAAAGVLVIDYTALPMVSEEL